MTNPDYCAVMLVIDRSGSMETIRASAQDAINEFIHDQAQATTNVRSGLPTKR